MKHPIGSQIRSQ